MTKFTILDNIFQGDNCPTPSSVKTGLIFHRFSCLDYRKQGVSKCDVYKLVDSNGNSFPGYCDFQSERGTVWTPVMSWSHARRALALLWFIRCELSSERERAELEPVPPEFGTNEMPAESLHSLASNMQLSNPRRGFSRLCSRKLKRFQHCHLQWIGAV